MEINHHILWLWLKELLGYNNKKALKLVEEFEDINSVFNADDFSSCKFLAEKEISLLQKKDLSKAWEVFGECEENQIGILTIEDSYYPALLREIENPPCPLFFKGHLKACLENPMLTVVGTRKSTGYSEDMTKKIVASLCRCGITIVCGVADGIDRFACEAALAANVGPVVILPFGHLSTKGMLTKNFPDILSRGVIISEVYPHVGTHKYAYHERNRILSGISHGTFVAQAPKKSGALMTANYATEQNKELFALMANAIPEFEGSNNLIKDGCYPVTDYSDILNVFLMQFGDQLKPYDFPQENIFSLQKELTEDQLTSYRKKHKKSLSAEEYAVFQLITTDEISTDYLIENAGIPMEQVLQSLTTLEFKGLIISCPGSKFKVIL